MNELLASLIISLQALTALLSMQSSVTQPQTQPEQVLSSLEAPLSTRELSFTAINNLYRGAVVNILCKGSGKFKSGTATGVIVSSTGKMITNAHIAQYMLLEQMTDAPISCTVRTGSPARDSYKATVLYMPESWVERNAGQIIKTGQKSTGQDDYAILQISKSLSSRVPLPNEFDYLGIDASSLSAREGQEVLIRAYPAEFLGSSITLRSLNPVSTVTTVKEVATFSDPTANPPTYDLISLGGSIVAQGGSSGGAVVSSLGKLVGIIVTSTRKEQTKDRNLKAITLSHINESIKENTGKSLDELLSMTLEQSLAEFQDSLIDSARVFTEVYNR